MNKLCVFAFGSSDTVGLIVFCIEHYIHGKWYTELLGGMQTMKHGYGELLVDGEIIGDVIYYLWRKTEREQAEVYSRPNCCRYINVYGCK